MKSPKEKVSLAVIRRLPKYYRYLNDLIGAGVAKISSKELGEAMGLTASQIRQDLNCFGGFGQQGYGYNVIYLREEIEKIMGLAGNLACIIIGAGHLGGALASSRNLTGCGFRFVGIFDNSAAVVGTAVGGMIVRHTDELAEFCAKEKPQMAIIAVPPSAASKLVLKLADLGVKGFWNFSGHIEGAPSSVIIEHMHVEDAMMTLSYRMKENREDE
ncbi:MAG TPA: redox-sensing transcriptional repressor Rex [Candidatus Acidoferrum sp.]|nr:redox-sensing transcriptional repressor Rex [Candidatus Acidoferrum sp.]